MSRIPQSFLDDLLSRVDIVEVVDQRVKLKRNGKNYSACCPFHDEKTPSFTVSPDKQFYYCFGCGASGTAINFLMEYDRSNFVDSVEYLAKQAGVEVPREQRSEAQDAREIQRKRCYKQLLEASEHFQNQLRQHPKRDFAVKYLQGRGLSGQIAKAYELGYAPPGWDILLSRFGKTESDTNLLIDCGLVVDKLDENKRYDRFRHRIMFPIRDVRGRCIGFGGRVLDDSKPKYLNSPETDVFHKGQELYGLYEARQFSRNLEQLIVVEGYMDVIALAQYGISNAVATLGTACGEDHLKLAFRHVKNIVFCFDGDKAGRNAAQRALQASLGSMEDGRQIRFLFLAEGQDPDSLVRQIGAERFQQQLDNALPLEQFLFDSAAEGVDLNSLDGRARFAKNAAPMLNQLPGGIFRSLMFDNLAKRTGLSTEQLVEFTDMPVIPEPANSEAEVEHANEPSPTQTTEKQALQSTTHQTDNGDQPTEHDNEPPAWLTQELEQNQSQHHVEHLSAPTQPTRTRSLMALSPARRASILLLDHPQLFNNSQHQLNIQDEQPEQELQILVDIMQYLQRRPQANFNNIMGWWGGSHGVEAQQALANIVSHPLFNELKGLSNFDAERDFSACLKAINEEQLKAHCKRELAQLNAKGLKQLSQEEKLRYQQLILGNYS
ncbi:DNA primase [Agaribacterium sp. ZY112]|uniref:DNA primase n=1 Tax=Agaribacterium sp. ZY112 TaxID=3233574 RepID=UPI003523147D